MHAPSEYRAAVRARCQLQPQPSAVLEKFSTVLKTALAHAQFDTSLYFKTHRQQYCDLLNAVHIDGDWEARIECFALAIITTATQAMKTAKQLHELSLHDRDLICTLGRAAAATLKLHRVLMERPIARSGDIVTQTRISPATVNNSLSMICVSA